MIAPDFLPLTDIQETIPVMRSDIADANTVYVGYARRGAATDSAAWCIKKVTNTDGAVLTAWASREFDQIWDNRTGLSYS